MDHRATESASEVIGHPAAEDAAATDRVECAIVELGGATERLFLILKYRSAGNYERAMQAVEQKIAALRSLIEPSKDPSIT